MASDLSDSQETISTSISEYSLNLSFEDIKYTVRPAVVFGDHKTILKDVCGSFNSGELTVIVGQSGAGKSSLMDILAGYTKPTSGRIYVNGELRNDAAFRRRSCYILQDNQVHHMLTVHESLSFAAELRLGHHVSNEQKKKRITEIITSLGLATTRNTRAGDLSGGQRKRLAIGLELISDPSVMFLDEPISGADSSISKQLVYLLHQLSRQGRTVVISMHQPSALLLPMMDRLYAMVDGRCAYIGSVPCLLPYLQQLNFICPPYHNPIDFLIEVSIDNGNELVLSSENGKSKEWSSLENIDNVLTETYLITCGEICLTTLPLPKEDPTKKILLSLKSTYPNSLWKQFTTLTKRAILWNWRDPLSTFMMTGAHCIMGLLIGIIYFNIGEDAKFVRDNFNLLFLSIAFLMFTSMTAVTIIIPLQLPVVRREHFNGWYSAGAYFMATLVSAIPMQTICTLSYSCITYWMSGQPQEIIRFLGFTWALLMASYVSLCIGLLNGSIFSVQNGVVSGPLFLLPFALVSGYFLRISDAPVFLQWMFHISFFRHGLVGLVLSIFGMDRQKLPCSDDYCHYTIPTQLLRDLEMSNEHYAAIVAALFTICFVLISLSYFTLKIRLKNKW